MVKLPTFGKLVRVGLPNSLRGEIWEVSSGAMYLRFANEGLYQAILDKYKNQKSTSTEEIEKDLNRSLPEYPGYQSCEGINRLRRVLTAYAWNNPELGYCQAMNIVVSALLIYTTEEQAFWILHILVDRFFPGYYSTNMYGALLDQITFEQLVEKTMPILWNHFKRTNVELSVASLPWFLSLYINSMPLEFAVRVLDMLFMEGPRILFQIGYVFFFVNGEELLQTKDDGAFLDIFKAFFQSIGQKEQRDNGDQHIKLTYREFSLVTNEMVLELRNQNQLKVGAGIESFTKRTVIRNLKDTALFSKEDVAILYDKYFGALYYANSQVDKTKAESKMNKETFQSMLSSMTVWAKLKQNTDNADANAANSVCSGFIDKIYRFFTRNSADGLLDFQMVILRMSDILHGDLMSHIDWFFRLYDQDEDTVLTGQDIINMSKDLYWLLSILKDADIAWDAATSLVVHSCEQSDVAKGDKPDETTLTHRLADLTMTANGVSFHGRIKQLENSILADLVDITLPSFRMVILTNESLEMLVDHGFTDSFKVVKSALDRQKSLGREVFENLFADGQKLAKAPTAASQSSSPTLSSPTNAATSRNRSPSSASTVSTDKKAKEEAEVDTFMDEWDHFDI
ncbi:rab-GTPase-TBC domain-containing protein [Parasitella parasitica]|nr:rab-GTPase-TBC domain-containing protein [Parasitella parasitica]